LDGSPRKSQYQLGHMAVFFDVQENLHRSRLSDEPLQSVHTGLDMATEGWRRGDMATHNRHSHESAPDLAGTWPSRQSPAAMRKESWS